MVSAPHEERDLVNENLVLITVVMLSECVACSTSVRVPGPTVATHPEQVPP